MILRCRDRQLPLDRVAIMGVLNVTPDSFSDGGLWLDPDAAVGHALEMIEHGAHIIDVGGESTRPGASAVPLDEESRRVIPVVERLADQTKVPIAIDTRKAEVARRALDAGASIVNDTSGEASTGELDRIAAESGAAIALMHSRGTPATMRSLTEYGDVTSDVATWLARRADELVSSGVGEDSIILDPGFGFAKTPEQNLEMLFRFEEFARLPFPILAGTSRKSFIGAVLELPEDQRVEGTTATVTIAVMKGAKVVRVHDVEATARTVRMVEAVMEAGT